VSKTIVLYGNHSVSYCSEVYYRKELESLGIDVIALQEGFHSGDDVLAAAKECDALFWVHSHGIDNPGKPMKEVLQELREHGVPSFTYHLDLYLALPDRLAQYKDSPYFNNIDYFFTADANMAHWLNQNKMTKGYYLPAGVPTEQCYMDDYHPELASDICFIGSYGYHPEWQWRPQLIDWLKETYGEQFIHWGGDGRALMRESNMNKAYASTKISIGDTLCMNFDYPDYFSDRIFNQQGSASFTIAPYIRGIEDLYEIGKEIVTFQFGNFDDLKHKIDYYLAHPKERNDIRIAGYLRTKKDHTYRSRMQTILSTIGLQ
jgi:hypothetical protein